MALLDVSDVLSDPDFQDELVCERNTETVNDKGRAVHTPASTTFYGVVTSDAGSILDIIDAGSYVKGSILVTTAFGLSEGDDTRAADIVIFKAKRYTVKAIADYSHFGDGFVSAVCEPLSLSGK